MFKKDVFMQCKKILFFAALIYTTSLLGYDYSHCIKYFKAASTPIGSNHAISIKYGKHQHHLFYSPTRPRDIKILKADPFIGLYLIDAMRTKQSYEILPLDKRTLNDKNLVFVGANSKVKGHIAKRQSGFINYASFSAAIQPNTVLSNICYQIYGIGVGNRHFIEKKYIDRFLSQKDPYYGDLGIRFASNKPIVDIVDPFIANNPFKAQDEIVSINGIKISNSGDAEWTISNLKNNSTANVIVKRKGKVLKLSTKVYQRYGGFLLKDTFLERFGIDIDDDMLIQSINVSLAGRFAELRAGDRILWINKEPIITLDTDSANKRFERLRILLSKTPLEERFDGKMQLLIMRDNLEIFIKV